MSLQAISFDLQITPGSIPPVLHMSQYDSGRQFTAYLKDETNTAFAPGTGATAKIKGFNAAGVAWEQAATVDGSTVVFTPSGAATDQFGVMPVTIEITVGDEILTPLLVVFDIQRAGYTNEEAVRSPEFQTALEAAVAAAIEEGGLGFSDDFKEALLACFAHVSWADEHGQDYYDALESALYPPETLVSITAVYLQDRPIYDTDDLDAIKAGDDLTVTANYSDGSSVVLADADYTLSGTLTAGTSVITVSYSGKSTTINVTVTAAPTYVTSGLIHHWDGIDNTGSGHSSTATTWADLVGNTAITVTNQFAFWAENALGFSQSQFDYVYAGTLDNPSACTVEVCLESTGTLPAGVLILNPVDGTGVRNCREVALYADNTVGGVGQSGYTYANPEASISDIRTVAVDYTDLSVNHLYVNAVSASLSDKTHSYRYSGSKAISVGGFDNNARFSGKIYSIRIYNRALTAAEIAQNYAVDVSRFGLE